MTEILLVKEPFGATKEQMLAVKDQTDIFVGGLTEEKVHSAALDYLRQEVFHSPGLEQLLGWMLEKHLKQTVAGYEDILGGDGEALERILNTKP